MLSIFRGIASKIAPSVSPLANSRFHTSAFLNKSENPTHFLSYNDKVYPPQKEGETPRPAVMIISKQFDFIISVKSIFVYFQFICHQKANIKYSPDKFWYIACLIRGMTIDEAIRQLRFQNKKVAPIMIETLLEAQEKAVKEQNVEYKSNLWVGKCKEKTKLRRKSPNH